LVKKLTEGYDYKGAFGVDGILQNGSYIINDINPRICAGFSWIAKHLKLSIPFNIVDILIRESGVKVNSRILKLMQILSIHDQSFKSIMIWGDKRLEKKIIMEVGSARKLINEEKTHNILNNYFHTISLKNII
jgi:hypothetical protein